MARYYLSLGSNMGDRVANLQSAIAALNAADKIEVTAQSHRYETEPVGAQAQFPFVNMALAIETDYEPLELLEAIQRIEDGLGRRRGVRWGPRTMDIDIVLCGSRVVETSRLAIPHREFRRRAFVLTPLAEIAADAVDPVTGKTVSALAAEPELQGQILRRLP